MSKLNIQIPHDLGTEEALKRIKSMLNQMKEEQSHLVTDVREEWVDNRGSFAFSAKGFDLSGVMEVQPTTVDIEAEVPFAVSLFSGAIKSVIAEKAKALLAK